MNKLIFLGTGSANNLERQMTSLCFMTSKDTFLIDCGDGSALVKEAKQHFSGPVTLAQDLMEIVISLPAKPPGD